MKQSIISIYALFWVDGFYLQGGVGALQHFRQGEPRLLRPGEGSGNGEFLKLGLL